MITSGKGDWDNYQLQFNNDNYQNQHFTITDYENGENINIDTEWFPNGNFLENNLSLSDNFEIFYDNLTDQTKIKILTRESNYDSSISLNGNFGLSIVDHGWNSGDVKLQFYDLGNNYTSGNDILGPVGEWWEQDVVLSGLDQSFTLNGGQGDDVIGGGSQNDILDGGEELFVDEYGNDIDENGLLGHDSFSIL